MREGKIVYSNSSNAITTLDTVQCTLFTVLCTPFTLHTVHSTGTFTLNFVLCTSCDMVRERESINSTVLFILTLAIQSLVCAI